MSRSSIRIPERQGLLNPVRTRGGHRDRALAGDGPGGIREALPADDLGMTSTVRIAEALTPAQYEMGAQWEHGALRIGREHETTELARRPKR